jgi:hypothetical protein
MQQSPSRRPNPQPITKQKPRKKQKEKTKQNTNKKKKIPRLLSPVALHVVVPAHWSADLY